MFNMLQEERFIFQAQSIKLKEKPLPGYGLMGYLVDFEGG
jgi:hypothetical protein